MFDLRRRKGLLLRSRQKESPYRLYHECILYCYVNGYFSMHLLRVSSITWWNRDILHHTGRILAYRPRNRHRLTGSGSNRWGQPCHWFSSIHDTSQFWSILEEANSADPICWQGAGMAVTSRWNSRNAPLNMLPWVFKILWGFTSRKKIISTLCMWARIYLPVQGCQLKRYIRIKEKTVAQMLRIKAELAHVL